MNPSLTITALAEHAMSHVPRGRGAGERARWRRNGVMVKTPRVEEAPDVADTTPMEGLLAAAREVLGMELAYLAEVRESELVLREVDGDTAAYGGVRPGFTLPARALVVPRDGGGGSAPARARRRRDAAGRGAPVRRRHRDPRLRGRAGAPRGRLDLRHRSAA